MSCMSRRSLAAITISTRTTRPYFLPTRYAHKTYYDSLGVHFKASQGDIKQAYYKLSLKYHPDMSPGEGEKFREITSAYEILGNSKLRRLYDRGALQGGHLPPPEPSHHTVHTNPASFDSRLRDRTPTTGRTAHFNFDDWSKAHYSQLLSRNEALKQKLERQKRMDAKDKGSVGTDLAAFAGFFVIFTFVLSIMGAERRYNDAPKKSKGKD